MGFQTIGKILVKRARTLRERINVPRRAAPSLPSVRKPNGKVVINPSIHLAFSSHTASDSQTVNVHSVPSNGRAFSLARALTNKHSPKLRRVFSSRCH